MHGVAAFLGLAVAAVVLGRPAPAPAQQAQTILPEMSVTAPKTQTPPEWYAPRPGTWGKLRVEEDKWPEIPCAASHVNTGAAPAMPSALANPGKCQDGPKALPAYDNMTYYGSSRCAIYHPLITVAIGRFAVEADVLGIDPTFVSADLKHQGACTIFAGYQHLPEDFHDMNQVARRGVGWHDFVAGGGLPGAQSTMAFADGARSCLALERFGPYWQGGVVWLLHATLCAADPAPIMPADIDAVVAQLHIHTYDAAGNLAPPPRP